MTSTNKEMLHLEMGIRLKLLAKENGLTREELGEITGYSSGHISAMMEGNCTISGRKGKNRADIRRRLRYMDVRTAAAAAQSQVSL